MRELAEDIQLHLPRRPGEHRIETSRYTLIVGPDALPRRNVVLGLRLEAGEVESVVTEVRALFASRGRHRTTWSVNDSSTPPDLEARLRGMGMRSDEPEPEHAAMTLSRPLGTTAPTGVVVRRVETFDDFCEGERIFQQADGQGEETELGALRTRFSQYEGRGIHPPPYARYLACVGGVAVAAGDAAYLATCVALCGGGTLPAARGHGVYRALVEARLEEGRRRGTPLLVTHAGSMSRPILERMGFDVCGRIRVLRDEAP